MKKLWHKILAYTICSVFASALFGGWAFGAFSQYGLPGIYNATPFTLSSGQGSALSLDSQGRAILSPSSSLSSITATSGVFASITATTGTFSNLTVTVINSSSRYLANSGSSTVPAYSFNGDEDTGQYSPSADTLGWTTAGTLRMVLSSSGSLGINTSSPAASLAMLGVTSANPVLINSSSGAQMFAIKTNGQTIVGPNTLLNSAQMVVEHPTTNNVALNFTNGSDYTAQMGRVSAGLMYIGGPNGTSLALQAFGTNRFFIIGTSGLIGINSSSPIADLSIVNRTATNTSTMSIGGTGVGKICLWNGASWTIESYASNSITPTVVTSTSCS